jgi:hypothetical protein
MADNGHTLRGIDYKSAFAFTHLFKGFRLAIDPSKLGLALAMILLVYAGGRLMDAVWPDKHSAVQEGQGRQSLSEVDLYESNSRDFPARRQARLTEMNEELRSQMTAVGKDPTKETPRASTVIGAYEASASSRSKTPAPATTPCPAIKERRRRADAGRRDPHRLRRLRRQRRGRRADANPRAVHQLPRIRDRPGR